MIETTVGKHVETRQEPGSRRIELRLSRPERRNALDVTTMRELVAGLEAASADGCSAVVLTAEGPDFCSGLDLTDLTADDLVEGGAALRTWRTVHEVLAALPMPFIVALRGRALNAGATLALAADFLVVEEDAALRLGEVRQGLAAPVAAALLSTRYPAPAAARLLFTGESVSGAELLRLGIAHDVARPGSVDDAARELADRLTTSPNAGLRRTALALRAARADLGSVLDRVLASADAMTGLPDRLDKQGA